MTAVAVNMVICGFGVLALGGLLVAMLARRWDAIVAALEWEVSPYEVQLTLPFAA